MKRLLWQLIRLFFGLLYRLVVLALFEKWIPFDKRDEPKAAKTPKPKRAKKSAQAPRSREYATARSGSEPAFFDVRSIEPSAEQVALMEGQHWTHVRAARKPGRVSEPSLRQMLRSKRTLRDALVVGAAVSKPPSLRR